MRFCSDECPDFLLVNWAGFTLDIPNGIQPVYFACKSMIIRVQSRSRWKVIHWRQIRLYTKRHSSTFGQLEGTLETKMDGCEKNQELIDDRKSLQQKHVICNLFIMMIVR